MYSNTVIAFIDAKQAALYFRYVVPCNLAIDILREERAKRPLPSGIGESLLPVHLIANQRFVDRLLAINEASRQLCAKAFIMGGRCHGPISGVSDEEYPLVEQRFADTLNAFTGDFGFADDPMDFPFELSETVPGGDVIVSLTQIPLVDTRSAPWDQILDFRKDPEAVRKLRRLRLFISENYAGKGKAYIEDDLGLRLDEYSRTAHEAGFETVLGAFGAMLDSKLLAGGLAGSVISTLAGAPVAAALSATSTVLLEVGKAALQIRKTAHEQKELLDQNPVSFFAYANERFKGDA